MVGAFQNSCLRWDFCVTETSVVSRYRIKSIFILVQKLTLLIWMRKMRIGGKLKVILMAGFVWCSLNTNSESEW